jgi:hypothetical protein
MSKIHIFWKLKLILIFQNLLTDNGSRRRRLNTGMAFQVRPKNMILDECLVANWTDVVFFIRVNFSVEQD